MAKGEETFFHNVTKASAVVLLLSLYWQLQVVAVASLVIGVLTYSLPRFPNWPVRVVSALREAGVKRLWNIVELSDADRRQLEEAPERVAGLLTAGTEQDPPAADTPLSDLEGDVCIVTNSLTAARPTIPAQVRDANGQLVRTTSLVKERRNGDVALIGDGLFVTGVLDAVAGMKVVEWLARRDTKVQIVLDFGHPEPERRAAHYIAFGSPSSNLVSEHFFSELEKMTDAFRWADRWQGFMLNGTKFHSPFDFVIAKYVNPTYPQYMVVLLAGVGTFGTFAAAQVLTTWREQTIPNGLLKAQTFIAAGNAQTAADDPWKATQTSLIKEFSLLP